MLLHDDGYNSLCCTIYPYQTKLLILYLGMQPTGGKTNGRRRERGWGDEEAWGAVTGIGATRDFSSMVQFATFESGWCLHRCLLCYNFLKSSYVLSIL